MEENTEKNQEPQQASKKRFKTGLPVYHPHAAGIDVGDTKHDVAISDGAEGHQVREFQSFTEDLEKLVKWLVSEGITTVAMESTGVYWLNLYLKLEEAGIDPCLVNARHVKNVTGRKRDDTDAVWLHKLHSCGLLQKSFQPDRNTRELREYVRHRRNLLSIGSDSVRRMQKALELMNIKLHVVISDILGKTGLLMVQSILKGERSPEKLLTLKDPRIKASDEDMLKSLNGIWKEEYIFMLKQAYDSYMFSQAQVKECEQKIKEQLLAQAAIVMEGDISELDNTIKKKPKKNQLPFNAQSMLKAIAGVDLCEVEGISEVTALELLSEIGADMSKWKSSKHFAAWLNLAPNTKITGGKIISSKMQRKKNFAGLTLRMAGSTLSNSKNPLGAYSRKMKGRLGKKGGVVATAHKLARIVYVMLKEKRSYDKTLLEQNHEKWKEQRIKYLEKQLAQLKKVA